MATLREEILQLADRCEQRWNNHELRSAGAKLTRLFAVFNFNPAIPEDLENPE